MVAQVTKRERMQNSNDDGKRGPVDESGALLFRDIFKNSPLSIWAAHGSDEEFKIVAWNDGAEEIYGYTAQQAIGRNYLDLFISDDEREQSAIDCDYVIQGEIFKNFVATDIAADGAPRIMITNCYRVVDPNSGKYVQVEVALDVSDQELFSESETELRELREIGLAKKRAREIGKAGVQIVDLNAKIRGLHNLLSDAKEILEDFSGAGSQGKNHIDEYREMRISRMIRRIERNLKNL